jgi:hypothetical protein
LTVIVSGPELLLLVVLSPPAESVAVVFMIVTPAGQRLVLVSVLRVVVLLVPEAIVSKVHVVRRSPEWGLRCRPRQDPRPPVQGGDVGRLAQSSRES